MADGNCTAKKCSKCGAIKPLDEFSRMSSGSSTGRVPACKVCMRGYYLANRHKINAYLLARYHAKQGPIRESKAQAREERLSSPVKLCGACGLVKEKSEFTFSASRIDKCHPHCKECKNKKSRSAPKVREAGQARLRRSISCKLRLSIYSGKMSKRTTEIVGYSLGELFSHIEKQFSGGMSWDNYGDWHLDHIVPISSFRFDGPDDPEVKRAWALTNLRPLWAKENYRKSNKHLFLI